MTFIEKRLNSYIAYSLCYDASSKLKKINLLRKNKNENDINKFLNNTKEFQSNILENLSIITCDTNINLNNYKNLCAQINTLDNCYNFYGSIKKLGKYISSQYNSWFKPFFCCFTALETALALYLIVLIFSYF